MLYNPPEGKGRFVQRAKGIDWAIVHDAVLYSARSPFHLFTGQVSRARKSLTGQ